MTLRIPATAAAIRQPTGLKPKIRMPAPISHWPNGGWARLARVSVPQTAASPMT